MSKTFNRNSFTGPVETIRSVNGVKTVVMINHDTKKSVQKRKTERMLKYMSLAWEFKIKKGKKSFKIQLI